MQREGDLREITGVTWKYAGLRSFWHSQILASHEVKQSAATPLLPSDQAPRYDSAKLMLGETAYMTRLIQNYSKNFCWLLTLSCLLYTSDAADE